MPSLFSPIPAQAAVPLVGGWEHGATARRGVQGLAPAKVGMTLASTSTELLLDATGQPGLL